MNGTQRRTLVSLSTMPCVYCSLPKGASQAEETLNGKKKIIIKSAAGVTPV